MRYGISFQTTRTADGTYTDLVLCDGNDLRFYGDTNALFDGSVDNVSVHLLTFQKEIAESTNYTGTHYVLPVDENDFAIPVEYVAEGIVAQVFGGETNATAGFSQVGLDAGANVFESSDVSNEGEFSLHADTNDTPTSAVRFKLDIQAAPFSISNDDVVRMEFYIRHIGTGANWQAALSVNETAKTNTIVTVEVGDITFTKWVYYWVHDANYRYFEVIESSGPNTGGVYFDNF